MNATFVIEGRVRVVPMHYCFALATLSGRPPSRCDVFERSIPRAHARWPWFFGHRHPLGPTETVTTMISVLIIIITAWAIWSNLRCRLWVCPIKCFSGCTFAFLVWIARRGREQIMPRMFFSHFPVTAKIEHVPQSFS